MFVRIVLCVVLVAAVLPTKSYAVDKKECADAFQQKQFAKASDCFLALAKAMPPTKLREWG